MEDKEAGVGSKAVLGLGLAEAPLPKREAEVLRCKGRKIGNDLV